MEFEKNEEEVIFIVETTEKQDKSVKKQNKIIRDAEKRLRKLAEYSLSGKMGTC